MNIHLEQWQWLAGWLAAAITLIVTAFALLQHVRGRRRAAGLIAAARVRSGHIPGELPTVRGGLTGFGDLGATHAPQALAANDEGMFMIVDEQPRIRIRYLDALDKKVEATLQVQYLDVQKGVVTGYCDLPMDVRRIPLRNIVAARVADSGQRFNIDTWVDAVRVARRRRGQVA